MFTQVVLTINVVWDDALWHARALWQESPDAETVVMKKSGRVPLTGDVGPDEAIAACARAITRARAAYQENPSEIRQ